MTIQEQALLQGIQVRERHICPGCMERNKLKTCSQCGNFYKEPQQSLGTLGQNT